MIRLWETAWAGFIPSPNYDLEIRTVICSTNPIANLNRLLPRGQGPRTLPDEQAAMQCLYLVNRSLDLTGKGQARWTMRWKTGVPRRGDLVMPAPRGLRDVPRTR